MKTVDLTGIWKAQMTATGGTQRLIGFQWTAVISVVQNGSIVSGKFETDMGLSGEISGSVLGDMASMTINQGPICPGTFHGSAKVTKIKMIGTYSGSDSNGTLEASFTASKTGRIGLGSLRWECACGIENRYSRSSCSNCKWTREQSEKWKAENPERITSIDKRDMVPPAFNITGMIITVITLIGFAYSTCIKPHCGRRAAGQGNPGARRNTGLMRTASKGIKQDYVFTHDEAERSVCERNQAEERT